MTTIELPFPVPLSACFTNVKGRGRVPTKRYREWKEQAAWMILSQRPKAQPSPVAITVALVAPDKRRRDVDNTSKGILDCLTQNGLIEDDDNRNVTKLTTEWVQDGPPCRVTITPLEPRGSQ